MKKTILITGASGWLGMNLVNTFLNGIDLYEETKNLSENVSINVFIQKNEYDHCYQYFKDKINYFFGDIRSFNDCKNFTKNFENATLFHLVGLIHPNKIKDLYSINLEGTKNIHQACLDSGIKKVVTLSSNSPFGVNNSSEAPFNNLSKYNPYLNYGESKKLMEEYIKNINPEKLKTTIIRAMWFYGPFQPTRQNLFFKMIKDGKVPLVGDGSNLRSMTNTENLSYALILVWLNNQTDGKELWIADEKPYSQLEIIQTIRKVLEEKFKIKSKNKFLKLPNIASDIAYFVDKAIQSTNFYNSKIHVLSELNKNIFCNIDYTKQVLKYNPKINLEIGIERNFNWLKKINGPVNF